MAMLNPCQQHSRQVGWQLKLDGKVAPPRLILVVRQTDRQLGLVAASNPLHPVALACCAVPVVQPCSAHVFNVKGKEGVWVVERGMGVPSKVKVAVPLLNQPVTNLTAVRAQLCVSFAACNVVHMSYIQGTVNTYYSEWV